MSMVEAPAAARGRWIRASLFGTASTSWQALAWFAPLGIGTVLVTMPADGGRAIADPMWWSVAISGQALLSAVVLVVARASRRWASGWTRVATLALGGAVRGAFVALAVNSAGLATAGTVNPLLRAVNSAGVTTLALGAIGLLLQGTRDYRQAYVILLDEAIAMRRRALDALGEIDPEAVARWHAARSTVLAATARARARLAETDLPPQDLAATAAVIAEAVTSQIRPMSHGLWFGTGEAPPRLRLRALVGASLHPWRLPMGDLMAILAVISVIGSVLRAGPLVGLGYAAVSLLLVWGLITVSERLAAVHPTAPVGVITLIAMPVIVFTATIAVGQGVLRLAPDLPGAAFGALTASIVVIGVLVLRRMQLERQVLLDTLIEQIDDDFLGLQARRARLQAQSSALGAFLHHSVQSELAAAALQLDEAARSPVEDVRREGQAAVLERLARLEDLTPPWAATTSPYDHIGDVATSWRGMAEVHVHLPPQSSASSERWQLAALAIEEAVANAVRAGGARTVRIEGRIEAETLLIVISDDGQGVRIGAAPGLGSAWLDRHLPGAWSREQGVEGTVLTLRIVR